LKGGGRYLRRCGVAALLGSGGALFFMTGENVLPKWVSPSQDSKMKTLKKSGAFRRPAGADACAGVFPVVPLRFTHRL
jgi:hypothetical protein